MNIIEKTAADIKSLEIQGATNIAKFGVIAFMEAAAKTKTKTKKQFITELRKNKKLLCNARPNEPLLKNALNYLVYLAETSKFSELGLLQALVLRSGNQFLQESKQEKELIAENGAKTIKNGMTLLTHCHSSTVTAIFKLAKKQGKKFSVICTETRPRFQGRKTAKSLVKAKIPTTLIVDSAVASIISRIDLIFVGADVITTDVSLINKVGTLYIAQAAKKEKIPFYVASELAKFNPDSASRETEKIEQRSPLEVWENPPKKLKILNPAFDLIPKNLITGFVTSAGIISPAIFPKTVRKKQSWVFKRY